MKECEKMNIRFDIIIDYLPLFGSGIIYTVGMSVAGIVIGTIVGMIIAFAKMSKNSIISKIADFYIFFFRGSPLLVQLLFINFAVVPAVLGKSNAVLSSILALSLNAAAFIAETFRGGIQSIDAGQNEAALALGFSKKEVMRHVILPQAVKRILPPLGNTFIGLIKDSSLASAVTAPEITYWANAMNAQYYRVWESYIVLLIIYLLLTSVTSMLLKAFERRMSTGGELNL